jgi:hypothetical protein
MSSIYTICSECYSSYECKIDINTRKLNNYDTCCKHWVIKFNYLADQEKLCMYYLSAVCQTCNITRYAGGVINNDIQFFDTLKLTCDCISNVCLHNIQGTSQKLLLCMNINTNKKLYIHDIQKECQTKVPQKLCSYCKSGYISNYKPCCCTLSDCNHCKNTSSVSCTSIGCVDGYTACMYCNGLGHVDTVSVLHEMSGQANINTKKCIKCTGTGFKKCWTCGGSASNLTTCDADYCFDCKSTGFEKCKGCNGNVFTKCTFCEINLSCLLCNNTKRIKVNNKKKCKMCVVTS